MAENLPKDMSRIVLRISTEKDNPQKLRNVEFRIDPKNDDAIRILDRDLHDVFSVTVRKTWTNMPERMVQSYANEALIDAVIRAFYAVLVAGPLTPVQEKAIHRAVPDLVITLPK